MSGKTFALGENVEGRIEERDGRRKLCIEIDLDADGRLSSTEVSQTLATTGRPALIPGCTRGEKASVTVFYPIPAEELSEKGKAHRASVSARFRKAA